MMNAQFGSCILLIASCFLVGCAATPIDFAAESAPLIGESGYPVDTTLRISIDPQSQDFRQNTTSGYVTTVATIDGYSIALETGSRVFSLLADSVSTDRAAETDYHLLVLYRVQVSVWDADVTIDMQAALYQDDSEQPLKLFTGTGGADQNQVADRVSLENAFYRAFLNLAENIQTDGILLQVHSST